MISGITAEAFAELVATPDIDYVTGAVHFGGAAYLTRGAGLTGWGTPSTFTFAVWIKLSNASDGLFSDANDFNQNTTSFGGSAYASVDVGYNDTYFDSVSTLPMTSTSWQCLMNSVDLSSVPSSALIRFYMGETDILNPSDTALGTSTSIDGGSNFYFGQDGYNAKITGDVADFRLWVGQYIDLSNVANRRLFIRSNGKPADPSLANAVLGTPIISFIATPGSETSTFVTNGGSGGAFSLTGSLTVASTSPTD